MKTKITKAIIPAAGMGTRFLPQTKAMPKEMLPVIDKPIIQYVVEDAVAAGITDIIIVTGATKRSIEDHFDHQYELERHLRDKGKTDVAEELERIAELANFIYVRQKGFAGNGTPILNAAHLIEDEPFLVLWADEFFQSEIPRAVQLTETFEQHQHPIITVLPTPIGADEMNRYSVIDIKNKLADDLYEINGIVEKPQPDQAPSNIGSVGGYVLTPDIIPILAAQPPDASGEVYLTAAINELAKSRPVLAKAIDGVYHDTGNKAKYLEAIVDTALSDPELGSDFERYIRNKLK